MRVHRTESRSGDDLRPCRAAIAELVAGEGGERSGHGIHRAVLAVGVASFGAVYAFAVGTSVFQSCPAAAQTRLQGRRTAGGAADRRRVDLEFRPERRAAYLAQHDANEDAAHAGPSALAESDGVSARRNAHQALQCSK